MRSDSILTIINILAAFRMQGERAQILGWPHHLPRFLLPCLGSLTCFLKPLKHPLVSICIASPGQLKHGRAFFYFFKSQQAAMPRGLYCLQTPSWTLKNHGRCIPFILLECPQSVMFCFWSVVLPCRADVDVDLSMVRNEATGRQLCFCSKLHANCVDWHHWLQNDSFIDF